MWGPCENKTQQFVMCLDCSDKFHTPIDRRPASEPVFERLTASTKWREP